MIEKMHTGKSIDPTPPRDGHKETKSRAGGRDTKNRAVMASSRSKLYDGKFP